MNTKTAIEKLAGKPRRKLANNTWLESRDGGAVAVKLHATDVLTFLPDGSTVADTGGWRTVTTKERLNEYLPAGLRIASDRGVWNWYRNGEKVGPFSEGDRIGPKGALRLKSKSDSAQLKLRARVAKYAKAYGEALPLPAPNAGDCWYCAMREAGSGKPLGECVSDKAHIISHIEEGYLVPSLALNALKRAGTGPIFYAPIFGQCEFSFPDKALCKERLVRAVRRYVLKQLGLPS